MVVLKIDRRFIRNLSMKQKVAIKRYLRDTEKKLEKEVSEQYYKRLYEILVYGTISHGQT